MAGDIWKIRAMPREQWQGQPQSFRFNVEELIIEAGYGGKLRDAWRLVTGESDPGTAVCTIGHVSADIGYAVAIAAEDLGAPVGQAFAVVGFRSRPR